MNGWTIFWIAVTVGAGWHLGERIMHSLLKSAQVLLAIFWLWLGVRGGDTKIMEDR